jgi:hypothetical protein
LDLQNILMLQCFNLGNSFRRIFVFGSYCHMEKFCWRVTIQLSVHADAKLSLVLLDNSNSLPRRAVWAHDKQAATTGTVSHGRSLA